MLVNLNYRLGVHVNFAQSRIPALVCSPQPKYSFHQTRSQGWQRGNAIPNSKVFRLIKYLKFKPNKYFSGNKRNCLKEPILLQLLLEYKPEKNNWSNVFRSCFWRTSLLYPTKCLCKLHFKAIANSSLITMGVTNITYPCFQCQCTLKSVSYIFGVAQF